jgi:energy-coupling factor transporter ATP-binding protein EcfA2
MYVAKVKLENIRGFHDARKVDLDLSRPDGSYEGWTVVTGPTGSGRSTFLRAIALAIGGPSAAPALAGEPQTWVAQGKSQGGIEVDLVPDAQDQFVRGFAPPQENIFADLVITAAGIAVESNVGRHGPWQDSPAGWFCAAYGPYRRLTTRQGPKGRLAGLFEPELAVFPQAVPLALRDKALSLINDGLVPSELSARWEGDELWVGDVPIRALGDGYKSLIALVLDLLRLVEPDPETGTGVVLIDEVEAHLHLSWQQWIGGWLTRHFPRIQFIVSTNSPYVCQSADPRGLILLPAAEAEAPAQIVDDDLYDRVVHGSGEDVALSELFGLDSPYPPRARRLRQELIELEIKVLDGQADEIQRARYAELQELLVSSPAARAMEIAARLQRDKARRGRQ